MKKSDKAFIEKIKSITIGTGIKAKPLGDMPCPSCGNPMKEHVMKLVAVGGVLQIPRKTAEKPKSEDQFAFAA